MGVYNKYPYTDFHELNLDWFLEEFKKVTDQVNDLDATVKEFTEFVTNYFDNLDAQQMVSDRLDELVADGTIANLIAPMVADPVTAWLESFISDPTSPVIDGSLRVGDAAAESSIVGASLYDANVYDLAATLIKTDKTQAQVTYTWSNDGLTLTTSGTSSATTWYDLYSGLLSASPFKASHMYKFEASGLGYMRYRVYCYDGSNPDTANLIAARNWADNVSQFFTIPANTVYLIIRIWAAGNTNCNNSAIKARIFTGPTDEDQLTFNCYNYGNYGTSALVTRFTHADDIDINSTIFVASTGGVVELDGFPFNNPGWLVTILDGDTSALKTQYALPYMTADSPLYRVCQNGTWTDWMSGGSNNQNVKMYSIGNSILTGSVWQNGSYSHLAPADAAPYAVIGNAINVPFANIEHHLYSSTGLLYDAGEGSFYSHLMAINDFSPYDVILTHLWYRDLEQNGWNVIKTAVDALVAHIRQTNVTAHIIIVSPPPCNANASYSGQNVFSATYAGGLSIADLDSRMHAAYDNILTYIDWQQLALSYKFQDITDGANVHPNSDKAYRCLSGYLAGRAVAHLHY